MRPKNILSDGIYPVAKIIIVGGQAWQIVGLRFPKPNEMFLFRSISVFGWDEASYNRLIPECGYDKDIVVRHAS